MKKILIMAAIAAVTVAFTGCEKQEEKPGAATLSALKGEVNKAAKDADKVAADAKKEADKAAADAKKEADKAAKQL